MVGCFSTPLDEGMKKTAFHLSNSVPDSVMITRFDLSSGSWLRQLIGALQFRPDIVCYLHGPTLQSLFALRILGILLRARTAIVAIHPRIARKPRVLRKFFAANWLIAASSSATTEFGWIADRTAILPSGVNLDTFNPVSPDEKKNLRIKFGLGDGFLVLHTGPAVRSRNLDWLLRVQERIGNVVMAASTTTEADPDMISNLRRAGVRVFHTYIPGIHELYQASDCYVFPATERGASIEFPLGVLEAMACGVPVVSTKYGALAEIDFDTEWIHFADDLDSFVHEIEAIMAHAKQGPYGELRNAVLKYSWQTVGGIAAGIFEEMLREKYS